MAKADMKKIERTDPEAQSADLVAENVARLRELFPELITEGEAGVSVNVDVLKQLVGDKVVTDAEEKYGLNWHGKRAARQLALTPSLGTLRPCPGDSVDWDTTQNLMIEGDNLEVLKLLQKSYAGKVKLIYIDPPYNTGKDFVYPDNFQDNIRNYLELTGQVEGGAKISSNTEASGRFHTDWLNMMYPRLYTAKHLMRQDGLIVIHIDEHELHSLITLIHEVLGEENDLGVCVWDKRNPKGDSRGIAYQHECLVVAARDAATLLEVAPIQRPKRNADRMLQFAEEFLRSSKNRDEAARSYRLWVKQQPDLSGGEAMYDRLSSDGRVYRLVSMAWPNKKRAPDEYFQPLVHPRTGKPCPVPERGWRNPPSTMRELLAKDLIEFGQDETTQPQRRYFLDENMYENVPSIIPFGGSDDALLKELGVPFENPKPVGLQAGVITWTTSQDALVMDFFAGSGSVGHAVMAQNATDGGRRRYILAQLPEPLDADNKDQKAAAEFCDKLKKPRNIAELTKERLRRAGKKIKDDNPLFKGDTGFRVFKLDSTNIKAWDPATDNLEKDLTEQIDHLKQDRSEQDILYELLLKLGLDLCVPMETKAIAGKQVHSIGGGVLMACLDKKIERKDAEKLALGIAEWHKALNPAGDTTCVFRDSAFADDVAKTNLAAILNQHGITTVRSI